jgi:hypothetical protein
VVLHSLHQDLRLLVTGGHHQATRVADAGVALVSITCTHTKAAQQRIHTQGTTQHTPSAYAGCHQTVAAAGCQCRQAARMCRNRTAAGFTCLAAS